MTTRGRDGKPRYVCPRNGALTALADGVDQIVVDAVLRRLEATACDVAVLLVGLGPDLARHWHERVAFGRQVALVRRFLSAVEISPTSLPGRHVFDERRVRLCWRQRLGACA